MSTGNELLQSVVDLVPEIGDDTGTLSASEQDQVLRAINSEMRKLEGEIASLGEDYQLSTVDWVTVAGRSPNFYTIAAGGDIDIADFKDIRYLEIIRDDAAGAYSRVLPITQLADKDNQEVTYWFDLIGNSGPGKPQGYFLRKTNEIQIEPISDAVYNMRMWYTAKYEDFVATDTVTVWPTELDDALIYGSVIRLKEFIRQFDDVQPLMVRYETARQRGLDSLQVRRDDAPHLINFQRYTESDYC